MNETFLLMALACAFMQKPAATAVARPSNSGQQRTHWETAINSVLAKGSAHD
jgi:hypothetical protein